MFCLNLMRIALELAKENQRLRGAGHQVLPALHLRRRGHEEDGRPQLPALGRGGRVLLRRPRAIPTAASRSSACARWSASSRSTPIERLEERWIEPFHEFRVEPALVPREQAAHRPGRVPPRRASDGRRTHVLRDRRREPDQGPAAPRPGPRRVPVALGPAQPLALPRAAPVPVRRPRGALRAGGGGLQDQGRQLQLARPGVVPDDVPDDRVAAQAGHGLRARRCKVPADGRDRPAARRCARWRRTWRTG